MDGMNFFDDKNLIHYEGVLGVFDYDPREFEVVVRVDASECLRYCGNGKSVNLPDGCINTSYMFFKCKLPEGFSLGKNFDTSKVTNMEGMFKECRLPEGFSLGEHFDTSSVTNMSSMFRSCILPKGFSLGESFDTSNVSNMDGMFACCELPEGFSLGEHFDTSNVINMENMFYKCTYNGISIYAYFETQTDHIVITKLCGLWNIDKDSLLLVIDMQNVYSKGEAWECPNYEIALKNILKVLKSKNYCDVIATRYIANKNPSGVWSIYNKQYANINADKSLNELDTRLSSLQDRCVYDKSVYSAYSIDKVKDAVACVSQVVVTGVVAECCVLSTVMDLIDAGVYVIYLSDAIAGMNIEAESATLKILKGFAPLHLSIMSTNEYLHMSWSHNI